MANQKAILTLMGTKPGNKPRSLRIILVDSDGGAVTFTDYGAATSWPSDDNYRIVGIQGQGTTAPATATSFQFKKNGSDVQKFINGAAVFDPTSSMADRLGAALGATIGPSDSVSITGRA